MTNSKMIKKVTKAAYNVCKGFALERRIIPHDIRVQLAVLGVPSSVTGVMANGLGYSFIDNDGELVFAIVGTRWLVLHGLAITCFKSMFGNVEGFCGGPHLLENPPFVPDVNAQLTELDIRQRRTLAHGLGMQDGPSLEMLIDKIHNHRTALGRSTANRYWNALLTLRGYDAVIVTPIEANLQFLPISDTRNDIGYTLPKSFGGRWDGSNECWLTDGEFNVDRQTTSMIRTTEEGNDYVVPYNTGTMLWAPSGKLLGVISGYRYPHTGIYQPNVGLDVLQSGNDGYSDAFPTWSELEKIRLLYRRQYAMHKMANAATSPDRKAARFIRATQNMLPNFDWMPNTCQALMGLIPTTPTVTVTRSTILPHPWTSNPNGLRHLREGMGFTEARLRYQVARLTEGVQETIQNGGGVSTRFQPGTVAWETMIALQRYVDGPRFDTSNERLPNRLTTNELRSRENRLVEGFNLGDAVYIADLMSYHANIREATIHAHPTRLCYPQWGRVTRSVNNTVAMYSGDHRIENVAPIRTEAGTYTQGLGYVLARRYLQSNEGLFPPINHGGSAPGIKLGGMSFGEFTRVVCHELAILLNSTDWEMGCSAPITDAGVGVGVTYRIYNTEIEYRFDSVSKISQMMDRGRTTNDVLAYWCAYNAMHHITRMLGTTIGAYNSEGKAETVKRYWESLTAGQKAVLCDLPVEIRIPDIRLFLCTHSDLTHIEAISALPPAIVITF